MVWMWRRFVNRLAAKFHQRHYMAQVKIDDIVNDLSSEMGNALEAAVREVLPAANFNRHDLFRAFQRAVSSRCSTWEKVRDDYVKMA
jgi:hypothetical protein